MDAPTSARASPRRRINDEVWQRPALPQPAAIKIVADFAKEIGAAKFFDAGDVQANGFQIVEDDRTGDTFTEAGASYMGFAASALLASAIADEPRYGIAFCGDGSFMMNPQILIDGVEHGVRGMIVIFDNRRMAAITGLQIAQYEKEFRTNDRVAVDYVRLAGAVDGVRALHGGWSAEELRARAQGRARARRTLGRARAGLLRTARTGRARRLGRMERRQLVRGRAARLDRAGFVMLPSRLGESRDDPSTRPSFRRASPATAARPGRRCGRRRARGARRRRSEDTPIRHRPYPHPIGWNAFRSLHRKT